MENDGNMRSADPSTGINSFGSDRGCRTGKIETSAYTNSALSLFVEINPLVRWPGFRSLEFLVQVSVRDPLITPRSPNFRRSRRQPFTIRASRSDAAPHCSCACSKLRFLFTGGRVSASRRALASAPFSLTINVSPPCAARKNDKNGGMSKLLYLFPALISYFLQSADRDPRALGRSLGYAVPPGRVSHGPNLAAACHHGLLTRN